MTNDMQANLDRIKTLYKMLDDAISSLKPENLQDCIDIVTTLENCEGRHNLSDYVNVYSIDYMKRFDR
jgi:hypothetical protein